MYKAEILADSLSPQGNRLTTMKITFPRFILAEMNTHRLFSRNSASSRAIPFKKMVQMVQDNPFVPIAWQKDHKGMQGSEYMHSNYDETLVNNWLLARDNAVEQAKELNELGVTKQLCNRLLEPFMWHEVIVTATEWENFFNLRCPVYLIDGKTFRSKKDVLDCTNDVLGESDYDGYTDLDWLEINKSQADIHIQAIAELMWDSYNESNPKELKSGEWHIPFGDNIDLSNFNFGMQVQSIRHQLETIDMTKVKIAAARCARISYQTLGDDPKIDYSADIKLHDRLIKEGHMSPFEHVARAMTHEEYHLFRQGKLDIDILQDTGNTSGWCGNFKGYIQYRYIIEKNYGE